MSTLDRYIARRTLRSILMTFLVIISIIMLIDFVETTRNLDVGVSVGGTTLLLLTLLKAPTLIEQTIPFVVLFGVMGALYALNRRSELTVMRAAGLSAWRFLAPAIMVTFALGLFWSLAMNPIAAKGMEMHEKIISSKTADKSKAVQKKTDIWLREGNDYEQFVIYAPEYDPVKRTLYEAEFMVFERETAEDQFAFSKRYDAKTADLLPSGYWQLKDVVENTDNNETQIMSAVALPTAITAKQLRNRKKSSTMPSFWKLPGQIRDLTQAGFSSVAEQVQFHTLLALPLTLAAMTIIAACVSMQMTRSGGTFRLMLLGGVTGFGVFFIDNIVKAFGEAGSVPIAMSVWIIPIFVLACGTAYLTKIEDG